MVFCYEVCSVRTMEKKCSKEKGERGGRKGANAKCVAEV